jgi:Fas-binding factor 1
MNLDLDDPLGDLLSEGSNDSFFGIEPAKKTVPKVEKKDEKPSGKKMEQLFGISEEQSELIKPKTSEFKLFANNEIASPIKSLPKRPATAAAPEKYQPSSKHIEQVETKSNDSLSSDLGFDPKKPRKKGNILDELLGIGESSKAQLPSKPSAREIKATISRQTTSETISENIASDNPAAAATRKTGRRQSAVVFSDPLGLFGPNEKEKEQIKKAQTKTARKSIAGTEWLFNDPSQEKIPSPFSKLKSSPAIQITANSEEKHEDEPASSNVTSLESKNTLTNIPPSNMVKNPPQLMESLASETTNTLNNLKQQEFQLMVATQMKTQENVLIEMKNKQQELLKQQEHQFNELLKKQISRQSELEEVIRNQQERINNHIQALMASHAQAPFLDNFMINKPPTVDSQMEANDEANPLAKVELEADVKRLEMEKLRLEDLLSNISDNHEKEIIMIEKSYKKRIQLMEENLESMEHRYKNEIGALEKFFSDKIKSISDERESNLETLKLHYEEMMQNIRKSKFMEFAIKEESSSYVDILKRASSNLETASGDIHSLHDVLQEKLIVLERDKEIQLSSREKRLEGMLDVMLCLPRMLPQTEVNAYEACNFEG